MEIIVTKEEVVILTDTPLEAGGTPWHAMRAMWGSTGLVRRLKEWGSLGMIFVGRNGRGKVSRLGLASLNNFSGLWGIGAVLVVGTWLWVKRQGNIAS